MIIIPIPKSASTSLFYLLGVYLVMNKVIDDDSHNKKENRYLHIADSGKDYNNGRFWDREVSDDYKYIYNWFKDTVELNANDVKKVTTKSSLFKNHILPTYNNLKLLEGVKKVVLLRNPDDVILALKRAYDRNLPAGSFFSLDTNFHKNMSEYAWVKKAEDVGLVDDIWRFYSGWSDYGGERLLITYNDILEDHTKVVNRIFKYYEIDLEFKNIPLPKLLYTRGFSTGAKMFGG